MSVAELEEAISRLSPRELAELRAWWAEYDMAQWDKQIEADSAAGRLDSLVEKALEEDRAGRTREL